MVKILVRDRIRCFGFEHSLLPRKFSLIPPKNSLFRCVGILPQALECARGLGSQIALGGRISQNSLFFSLLAGTCLIGMEACATAHYWARELRKLGHQVRLMPAKDVKAYVKRNKNDAADAEAICEAVRRPTMRFVEVKSAEQQATAQFGACRAHPSLHRRSSPCRWRRL